ncbi:energy coupling factor transporter S component ThiW [Aerococcus urinae]|uniref:energy coupling factor transporter S component ThiW n=1 Tax=Aerococcus mictus TaxID=2976810 RepID=UPI001245A96E|nr:energy coupling factor transporter S component ThiW [Aerococcus mictus]KAA9233254.1 energy coupling factor transporter S component ThiW [Aerococcus mictus]
MNKKSSPLILVTVAMFVAIGVVISPIFRVEGFAPTAHFVNVVCSVLLGPWYSLLNAILTAIIRMSLFSVPPLALTGQVFGAVLSGILYRLFNGSILACVLGEIIGTGIIGAIASYPVMALLLGKTGITWLFYVPSFLIATIIGGVLAYFFLATLRQTGLLYKMQKRLGVNVYDSSKKKA